MGYLKIYTHYDTCHTTLKLTKNFCMVLSMVVHRNKNVKIHQFFHSIIYNLVLIYIIYTSCRNLYLTGEKFAV